MRKVLKHPAFRVLAQLVLSGTILLILARGVNIDDISVVWKSGSLFWLVMAILVKASALLTHEYRLWLALPKPRPPTKKIISIGLAAGVLNLALPARAGDVAAIAFMKRECDIQPATGTSAVGVTSFLEAALFGFFLLAILAFGAAQWTPLFVDTARLDVMVWIVGGMLAGFLTLLAMVFIGRAWAKRSPPKSKLLCFARNTVIETASMLQDLRYMTIQTAAAAIQVTLVVAAFSLAILASGAVVDDPTMAASGVLAVSSLAAFILPPTMAAGPAAASLLVLPMFGATDEAALAYAGTYWLVAHAPALAMGLPALWSRR